MSQKEKPAVLVFGANGQVGSALVKALKDKANITALTRHSSPSGDLGLPDKLQSIIENIKPDIVVNAAAYTAVDKAESEPDLAELINAKAPSVIAMTCARLNIPFIHYSTDYVFDGSKHSAYTEDDPPCPINIYGQTKLAGENEIMNSGCQHYILRTSWVYDAKGKNFLNTMLRLARERDSLSVVDDQYGSPTTAEHIAEETTKLIDRIINGRAPESGIYHLTCDGETTWHDFAKEIFQLSVKNGILNMAPKLEPITTESFPTPAKRPKRSTLNNSKAELAWSKQPLDWKTALARCLSENSQPS